LGHGGRSKLRILFLGTESLFSQRALEQLLEGGCQLCGTLIAGPAQSVRGAPPAFPELPVARPPSVQRLAEVHDIPLHHALSLSDSEVVSCWESLAPELVVSAGFPFILPSRVLALPEFGGLNLHPSLLPAYRGPSPLFWQCRDGVAETGISVHVLTERVDAGDIVAQTRVPFPLGVLGVELIEQLAVAGGRLVVAATAALAAGELPRRPQCESAASYFPAPTDADFELPLRWSAERAFRFMRGTAHWSRPYPIKVGDERLELEAALDFDRAATLGDAFTRCGNELRVRFAAGVLRAREQRA
jgi:methionyl-tRNA formyltransferase